MRTVSLRAFEKTSVMNAGKLTCSSVSVSVCPSNVGGVVDGFAIVSTGAPGGIGPVVPRSRVSAAGPEGRSCPGAVFAPGGFAAKVGVNVAGSMAGVAQDASNATAVQLQPIWTSRVKIDMD